MPQFQTRQRSAGCTRVCCLVGRCRIRACRTWASSWAKSTTTSNHQNQPPLRELQRALLISPNLIPMCPRYAPAEAVYVPAAGAVSAFAGLRVAPQKCRLWLGRCVLTSALFSHKGTARRTRSRCNASASAAASSPHLFSNKAVTSFTMSFRARIRYIITP